MANWMKIKTEDFALLDKLKVELQTYKQTIAAYYFDRIEFTRRFQ